MTNEQLDIIYKEFLHCYDKQELIEWLLEILPESALQEIFDNITNCEMEINP